MGMDAGAVGRRPWSSEAEPGCREERPESLAVQRVFVAAMRHLESTCSIDRRYGQHAPGDLAAVGLRDVQAEGRCPIVRGGTPLARDFLRLTVDKLREPVLEAGDVTTEELERALADLQDPELTIVAPMTVAAWGRRPDE
jgi:hypothetical protein